ncbi:MAG: nitroreductase family protein [Chloroflexi bacterium]|nr:nitroreductase family protein [Chloroflexota bacterium]
MEIDDFISLARKRRSIRKFKSHPVPDDHVQKMLEAARWAMSGANAQPWEFVVVKDRETIKKIAELYYERQATFVNSLELTRAAEYRHHQVAFAASGPLPFKDAPLIIVVCGDPRTVQATVLGAHINDGEFTTFHMNMANVVTMVHLAAAALGLGAQWVSMLPIWEGSLKTLLGIPEVYRVYTLIPVGYPAFPPRGASRRRVDELVHYEKYDQSRYKTHQEVIQYVEDLRKKTRTAYSALSDSYDG